MDPGRSGTCTRRLPRVSREKVGERDFGALRELGDVVIVPVDLKPVGGVSEVVRGAFSR